MESNISFDNHIHTTNSKDGESSMEENVKEAIKKGFRQICFTDHMDFEKFTDTDMNEDFFNYERYKHEYEELKRKYFGKIDIKMGIELGLQPEIKDEVTNFLKGKRFDFIIGSLHYPNSYDIYLPNTPFFRGKTQQEAYHKYFEEVLKTIRTYKDEFDVFGHLDYVIRYGNFDNPIIKYADYQNILDEILMELIKRNKGIEINTSGYNHNLNAPNPSYEIIKRFKQLGGKYLTIGSDAHEASELGQNFEIVNRNLQHMGINYLTVFENRRPRQVYIGKRIEQPQIEKIVKKQQRNDEDIER